MKLGVLVIGDGRDYIHHTLPALMRNISTPVTARLMVNDSESLDWYADLIYRYPEWDISGPRRRGMAGAVQCGFDMCVAADVDAVLWCEDDMEITRPLPILSAFHALDADQSLAQIVFKREPWYGSDIEMELGDVQAAIHAQSTRVTQHDDYSVYDYIFSLNPCLIPKRVLQLGYSTGNEAGMTTRLLDLGYQFAMWGHEGEAPYVRHLGVGRSAGWRL